MVGTALRVQLPVIPDEGWHLTSFPPHPAERTALEYLSDHWVRRDNKPGCHDSGDNGGYSILFTKTFSVPGDNYDSGRSYEIIVYADAAIATVIPVAIAVYSWDVQSEYMYDEDSYNTTSVIHTFSGWMALARANAMAQPHRQELTWKCSDLTGPVFRDEADDVYIYYHLLRGLNGLVPTLLHRAAQVVYTHQLDSTNLPAELVELVTTYPDWMRAES